MVLFNQIIRVLTLTDGDGFLIWFFRVERGQSRRVGATFIDSYDFWLSMVPNCLAKETQCGSSIPRSGEQKVDGLACGIDSPVLIFPLTVDF